MQTHAHELKRNLRAALHHLAIITPPIRNGDMRLLVVEDSRRLRESLVLGLQEAGYAVDEAPDGEAGLWLATTHPYDAIVLDRMLPRLDGLSLLLKLRASGHRSPVLLLTARDRLKDKVEGLQSGADDYLVKPFAFEELVARVDAMVRRKHNQATPNVRLGHVSIDLAGRSVTRDGARLTLSAREYAVLEYLAMRRGQIISRIEIESHVYGQNADLMSNVIDTVVYSLRRKLDLSDCPSMITTHRGMGYELNVSP